MSTEVEVAAAVYDAAAESYAAMIGTTLSEEFEGPLDRALLLAFAESLGPDVGIVADVGCGPGRVAAFLASRGLDVRGVDVSPAMLAVARAAHPEIPFEHGELTALPYADGSLAAVVCWYSIIHTPPGDLREAFVELERVLAGDGRLLMAFQAGDGEGVHRTDAYGTGLPLTSYRHDPDHVTRSLAAAGLGVETRTVREPELAHESTPQAFLVARVTR